MASFPWPHGKRAAVSLSFDDARVSQIDTGMEILERHGIKATFYLSPPLVSQRLEGWKEAVAQGHEMGNHTMTHPCSGNAPWSRGNAVEDFTVERFERELLDANEFIEKTLGVKPATYAYCCGEKLVGRGEESRSIVPLVARNFIAGRGTNNSPNDAAYVDLAQICGVSADRDDFAGLREMLDRTVREGGWLVLYAHEVGNAPGTLRVTEEVLEAICAYCTDPAHEIWVDTVAAVGAHVRARRG